MCPKAKSAFVEGRTFLSALQVSPQVNTLQTTTMNPQIFREYDIRGVIGVDLTREVVRDLGRGIGSYLLRQGAVLIALGRDGRESSPEIREHLRDGLRSTGLNVVDLGLAPTPLTYYATHVLDVGGSIMITGSHNPPEFNGFKICLGHEAIYGTEIHNIRKIIESGKFAAGTGAYNEYDLIPEYISDLTNRLHLARPVKVAVDCGNGVGGLTSRTIFTRLGCQPEMLFEEVDGKFPNHHPDPTVEKNLVDLKKAVTDGGLELGIAFDGDADRIGVVDEKGGVLWGDQILAILARDLLIENPGSTIIGEVKCSQLFFDDVEKHGGEALMWKVGHSLIKSKMSETGALLAGEMSGHIFYKHRYYGFDDAVYVAGRLLEIVSRSNKPVSRFLEDWPKLYNTPEIRVACADEIKFAVVEQIRDKFRTKYQVVDVDGMRVITPGGWGLLRASNTQPVVVMRFEAESPGRLREIQQEVESALHEATGSR